MTIRELIEIADKAYGDEGLVLAYFENPTGNHGDGLANFIAVELQDTFDHDAPEDAQREEATRVMDLAARQLDRLANAF